ncbi:unnamed protein product, partial [Anisakis simplex]|uniref:Uncharacterized protein n=1 Tax=Anisakis simplex TaxID=6269 RepID=A0A0M3JC48_ANISI
MKNRKHTKKQKPLLTTTMATTTDQVVTSSLAPGEAYVDDQGLWTMVPTEASSSTTVPNDISSEEQANADSLTPDEKSRTGETSELEQKATTTESKSENTIVETSEIDHAKADDTTEVMERSKTEFMIREEGENLISMNSSADHDHNALKEHEQIALASSIAKEENSKTAVQSSQNVEFSWSDGKVPKHRLADHIQKNPTSVRGHSVVRTDIVEMPFGSDHKENRLRISSIPQPTMRETHTTTLERNANESTTLQIDDKELTEVAVVLRKLMKSNVTLEQLAKLLGEDIDNSTSHSSQIGEQRIENNGLKNGATKMFLKSP